MKKDRGVEGAPGVEGTVDGAGVATSDRAGICMCRFVRLSLRRKVFIFGGPRFVGSLTYLLSFEADVGRSSKESSSFPCP